MVSLPKKPLRPQPNLTPMVDMVFLLLIFFLLTANFLREQGIFIDLPEAKTASVISKSHELTVFVNARGKIFLNNQETKKNQLYDAFYKLSKTGVFLIIKADKMAPVAMVVKVMDMARLAGVNKIILATQREK